MSIEFGVIRNPGNFCAIREQWVVGVVLQLCLCANTQTKLHIYTEMYFLLV